MDNNGEPERQGYLANFDFMYTYCKDTDTERMNKVIDRTGGRRLTYKPLTTKR